MEHADAILGEQVSHGSKKFRIMIDTDMFEHADRDDAVVCSALFSVVAKVKANPLGQPGFSGALVGNFQLLARQSETRDIAAPDAGQI